MVYLTNYPNFNDSPTPTENSHTPHFLSIKAGLWYGIRITEKDRLLTKPIYLEISARTKYSFEHQSLVRAAALCTPNWLRTRSFNKRALFMLSFIRKLWETHWNIRCTELVSHFIILVILLVSGVLRLYALFSPTNLLLVAKCQLRAFLPFALVWLWYPSTGKK